MTRRLGLFLILGVTAVMIGAPAIFTIARGTPAHAASTVYEPPPESDCQDFTQDGNTQKKEYPDGMVIVWECVCDYVKQQPVCIWMPGGRDEGDTTDAPQPVRNPLPQTIPDVNIGGSGGGRGSQPCQTVPLPSGPSVCMQNLRS